MACPSGFPHCLQLSLSLILSLILSPLSSLSPHRPQGLLLFLCCLLGALWRVCWSAQVLLTRRDSSSSALHLNPSLPRSPLTSDSLLFVFALGPHAAMFRVNSGSALRVVLRDQSWVSTGTKGLPLASRWTLSTCCSVLQPRQTLPPRRRSGLRLPALQQPFLPCFIASLVFLLRSPAYSPSTSPCFRMTRGLVKSLLPLSSHSSSPCPTPVLPVPSELLGLWGSLGGTSGAQVTQGGVMVFRAPVSDGAVGSMWGNVASS